MSTPLISVIVPVYNVEAYLRQCLDSILAQTIQDIEIICVDDGSTDSSPEILREYAHKDSRIQVFTQENKSAGAARNKGLSEATGRYLSFLDSDDFFEPEMLEEAVKKLEKDRADFVVFRSDHYNQASGAFEPAAYSIRAHTLPPYTPFSIWEINDNVLRAFLGWAWDKVYVREFVLQNRLLFQEQRTTNDLLFVYSALLSAGRITWLDKVLAHQRVQNKGSLSNTREKSWECVYHALTALRDFMKDRGLFPELERDFTDYALHLTLWHYSTLQGEAKDRLGKRLAASWLDDLGVTGRPAGYFYLKEDEQKLEQLLREAEA